VKRDIGVIAMKTSADGRLLAPHASLELEWYKQLT